MLTIQISGGGGQAQLTHDIYSRAGLIAARLLILSRREKTDRGRASGHLAAA